MKKFLTFMAVVVGLASASTAGAATFAGEFWDADGRLGSIDDALAVIAGGPADATFSSTVIDYPRGGNGAAAAANGTIAAAGTTLAAFLGVDAASLSGERDTPLTRSVFRFTGFLDLLAGAETFEVRSDDGFRLTVGGTLVDSFGNRAFRGSPVTVEAGDGRTPFELVYYEDQGNTGVEFALNGAAASPAVAPIPLPAGLPLLAGALGVLAFIRRRR